MKSMIKPCKECPFVKTSAKGWLGDWVSPSSILDYIMRDENAFPCHMTHSEQSLSPDLVGTENHPLCFGALACMKKSAKLPRDKKIAQAVKDVEFERGDILSSIEFLKHHTI